MSRRNKVAFGALGAAGLGSALMAVRQVMLTPPDPAVAARAEVASYSGPWTHGYKVANGMKLHYAEMGNPGAPLVILLHGFPECWYEWHKVMPRLSERYHVVAVDMRGYNWSERPRGVQNYTTSKVSADIAALIEAFGQARAHVVGHDWGGSIAWYVGALHPERVDKLVVINAPHPEAYKRELLRLEQVARSYYVFFFQWPLIPEAVVRLTLRSSLPKSAVVPGAFTDEALDMYEHAVSQKSAATAMINYYRAAFRDFLRLNRVDTTVKRPTMLIWGMEDFALSSRLTEGLERWVPDLQVERVEGCGHWVPEEKPGLVVEKLLAFFS